MDADTSIAWATWALTGVTLLGGGAVIWGLFDGTRVRKEQVMLLKRRETVRMYTSTVDSRTQSGTVLPHDRDAAAVRQFIIESHQSAEKRLAIRHYLNYWEGVAAAVEFDVLDVDLLKKLVGTRLQAVWRNYYPYIAERRTTLETPGLFGQLEYLAISWGATLLAAEPTEASDPPPTDGRGGEGEEEE